MAFKFRPKILINWQYQSSINLKIRFSSYTQRQIRKKTRFINHEQVPRLCCAWPRPCCNWDQVRAYSGELRWPCVHLASREVQCFPTIQADICLQHWLNVCCHVTKSFVQEISGMRNLCFALAQVSIYHCTRALSFNSSMLSSKYNDGCCTLRFSLSSCAERDITDTGNALPNSLSPLSLNSLERSCFCSSLRASAASQRYLRSSAANPKRWVQAAAAVVFFIFTFLLSLAQNITMYFTLWCSFHMPNASFANICCG